MIAAAAQVPVMVHVLRWVVGIVVAAIVIWCVGVLLSELRK